MITLPVFNISFGETIALLKKLKLYKGLGPKIRGDYSDEFLAICRDNKHTDIYKVAIRNLDYEILLSDDSIIQFNIDNNKLRFCFIQNPNTHVGKIEYLKSIYSEEELIQLDEATIEDLVDHINEDEYEQFLNEQEINLGATIIRYDYDRNGYKPLIHSCSHLHVGLNDNFRITSSVIVSPLKFAIFCLKIIYYDKWQLFFDQHQDITNYLKQAKRGCDLMVENWNESERHELFLG